MNLSSRQKMRFKYKLPLSNLYFCHATIVLFTSKLATPISNGSSDLGISIPPYLDIWGRVISTKTGLCIVNKSGIAMILWVNQWLLLTYTIIAASTTSKSTYITKTARFTSFNKTTKSTIFSRTIESAKVKSRRLSIGRVTTTFLG